LVETEKMTEKKLDQLVRLL